MVIGSLYIYTKVDALLGRVTVLLEYINLYKYTFFIKHSFVYLKRTIIQIFVKFFNPVYKVTNMIPDPSIHSSANDVSR